MSLLWKIGGIALVAGALFLLVRMYGGQREELGAANEAKIWQQKVIDAEKGKLVAYQAGVASVQAADARYVETVRDRIVPVTRTLIERATAYAATPDGASLCLAADRVQSLEQTGRALFNPATPSAARGVDDAVHALALGEERGRLNVQGASRAEFGADDGGSLRLRAPPGGWGGGMAKSAGG